MITCSRKIHFCAGHRVYGHESKCANLHGHNYVAWITAKSTGELDKIGRVVDFSVIKEKVGAWIETHWDHTTLLFEKDPALEARALFEADKPVFVCSFNPTAELMAEYLLKTVCPPLLQPYGVIVTQVRLFETENCYADAVLNEHH